MTELRKLKTNKAIGLDKISAKLLKDASEVIGVIIQKLINMSITQCCFANLWTSAKVTALCKSCDTTNCDNYRPISILPTVLRIFDTKASLFADDTVVYCAGSTRFEIQEKLNDDLFRIKGWLNNHRLTISTKKSQFMTIGSSQRIKAFESMNLQIDENELEKVTSYKYLGVVISETVNRSEHIEMIQKKLLQRLGVLRRIKHLLPESTREVVVNTLILLLLDYGDLVWGDKANDTLMNSLQVLQNKAAKEILNMRNDDSSTMALQLLNWKPLKLRRQFHRCQFMSKSIENNSVDFQFDNCCGSQVHSYNTRYKIILDYLP